MATSSVTSRSSTLKLVCGAVSSHLIWQSKAVSSRETASPRLSPPISRTTRPESKAQTSLTSALSSSAFTSAGVTSALAAGAFAALTARLLRGTSAGGVSPASCSNVGKAAPSFCSSSSAPRACANDQRSSASARHFGRTARPLPTSQEPSCLVLAVFLWPAAAPLVAP